MCEDFRKATGVQNQYDDTKNCINVLILCSRSVFVIVVVGNLAGERDYGEQTLATPTHQRLHVPRGVVNMVLLAVKVQCAKSVF